MLTNETYTGTAYFRKYKRAHKDIRSWLDSELMREKSEWIPVPVPPLVTQEVFAAAVTQLKKNREFAARKAKRSYLFSKLLYCSRCGFRMRGNFAKPKTPNSQGSRHYSGVTARNYPGTTKRCKYCGVIAESRLMPIWESLKVLLNDPEFMYEKIRRVVKRRAERSRVHTRLEEIPKELCSLEEQRRRVNFVFLEAGEMEESEYKKALLENDTHQEKLQTEQTRLNQLLVGRDESQKQIDIIKQLFESVKNKLENASYETQSLITHLLVEKIDLHLAHNYAQVTFGFPGPKLIPALTTGSGVQDNRQNKYPTKKSVFMQDNRLDSCPTKEFYLTVKIPLISTEEWRKFGGSWHLIQKGKRYRKLEAESMKKLTVRKAHEMSM